MSKNAFSMTGTIFKVFFRISISLFFIITTWNTNVKTNKQNIFLNHKKKIKITIISDGLEIIRDLLFLEVYVRNPLIVYNMKYIILR